MTSGDGRVVRACAVGAAIVVIVGLSATPSAGAGGSLPPTAAGWSAPVAIAGGIGADGDVALSADGSVGFAASIGSDGITRQVRVARWAEGSWSAAVPVALGRADDVRLAVSSDGSRALAVWSPTEGTPCVCAVWWDGSTWGPPVDVAAGTASLQTDPSVSLSGDGATALVAWGGHGWYRAPVRVAVARDGSWATPVVLGGVGKEVEDAVVAISRSGTKAVVAWGESNPVQPWAAAVRASVWDGAGWGPSTLLAHDALFPQVAISASGARAVVAWTWFMPGFAVGASVRQHGQWQPSVRVSGAGRPAKLSSLAMAGGGGSVLVGWTRASTPSGFDAAEARRWASQRWGPVIVLAPAAQHPAVAISDDGSRSVATWRMWRGAGNRRSEAAMAWGDRWSMPVALTGVSNVRLHRVAISASGGRALAAWHRLDTSADGWVAASWDGTMPRAVTTVAGWPRGAVVARSRSGGDRTVAFVVRATPARLRTGVLHVRRCGATTHCRWVVASRLSWPSAPSGAATVRVRLKAGTSATVRLVLPATAAASGWETRPLVVRAR